MARGKYHRAIVVVGETDAVSHSNHVRMDDGTLRISRLVPERSYARAIAEVGIQIYRGNGKRAGQREDHSDEMRVPLRRGVTRERDFTNVKVLASGISEHDNRVQRVRIVGDVGKAIGTALQGRERQRGHVGREGVQFSCGRDLDDGPIPAGYLYTHGILPSVTRVS